jgi:hypothetical protein
MRQDFCAFDEFGDRLFAEAVGELYKGLDDELVGAVFDAVADELAVDLDVVRQVFEVVEGSEAGAEVVERESAAQCGELVDKLLRAVDVFDRCCFGDLEDQSTGISAACRDDFADVRGEVGIAE